MSRTPPKLAAPSGPYIAPYLAPATIRRQAVFPAVTPWTHRLHHTSNPLMTSNPYVQIGLYVAIRWESLPPRGRMPQPRSSDYAVLGESQVLQRGPTLDLCTYCLTAFTPRHLVPNAHACHSLTFTFMSLTTLLQLARVSVPHQPLVVCLLVGPPPEDHLAQYFDVPVSFSPLPSHIHASSYTHSSDTILKHASFIISTAVSSSIHSFIMRFTTLIAAMTFVAFGFTAPADPQEKAHGLEARQWQCSFPYYDQLCDECYHEHGCEFGCDWYVSFKCHKPLHTDAFHSPDCMKLSVRLIEEASSRSSS